MDRSHARALLERTTEFEFRDDRVVVREVRLLDAIATLQHESTPRERPAGEREVATAA